MTMAEWRNLKKGSSDVMGLYFAVARKDGEKLTILPFDEKKDSVSVFNDTKEECQYYPLETEVGFDFPMAELRDCLTKAYSFDRIGDIIDNTRTSLEIAWRGESNERKY